MASFTVDTHLFRELGELLVGRDSTALIELIKNAYDADASRITVYGADLDDLQHGLIRLVDDGTGMTPAEFEAGFLRIASRTKEAGERRSRIYGRRYTGAKGIGRLAAHKLAALLEVASSSRDGAHGRASAIEASIDWDAIEALETLDDVAGSDALMVREVRSSDSSGTTITLRRLRKGWTGADRGRFLAEVQTFSPALVLTDPLPAAVLPEPLLFEHPFARDSTKRDPGFTVDLEGDLTAGDDYWRAVAEACSWVIEVDSSAEGTTIGVAPTVLTAMRRPGAERRIYQVENDSPWEGPSLQARILVRDGRLAVPGPVAQWATRVAGVRVFLEGFRVLPYGERSNDWLSLDSDYARRSRNFPFEDPDREATLAEEGALKILPNAGYFGGVFLTEARAASLRMLVNREGFVPDSSFVAMTDTLRRAISIAVRVRSAAPPRVMGTKPSTVDEPSVAVLKRTIDAARTEVEGVGSHLGLGELNEAHASADRASRLLFEADGQLEGLMTDTSMLRVLASVGTQMAAFIHEVRGLVSSAEAAEASLDHLSMEASLDAEWRKQVQALNRTVSSLRQGLDRQASYLIDVLAADARRRRSRQPLLQRANAVLDLFSPALGARGITVSMTIPDDLTTPPMFRAELVALLVNLLSNAVKAAGDHGRIFIAADQTPALVLRIENSGVAVDEVEAERWFRPFESSTESVDPMLGQGMGMGLPISRRIITDYGGSIEFVTPTEGLATAIEVRWAN